MSPKLQPKSSNHNSNCQHDATNQTTPIRCTSAAKQLDDRVEPKARAQSQQTLISICRLMPPIRRHQLECPRTRAQISCNHCSQQLLARCCQTYRRHQADRTPMKPALHDFRLTGSAWGVAQFHLCQMEILPTTGARAAITRSSWCGVLTAGARARSRHGQLRC